MACLKCGSAWTTRWGHDKLSCPECCKQQRAKARKLGHLPAVESKTCKSCGLQFEAVGGNAIARTRFCPACRDAKVSSQERKKHYRDRVAAGVVVPQTRSQRRQPRQCLRCSKQLRLPNQKKYCSNACFVADRNDGIQEWDRTNQLNANSRRIGVSFLPSRLGIRNVLGAFPGFLIRLRAFQKRIARLHCLTCHALIEIDGKRYCSKACMMQHAVDVDCRKCGRPAKAIAGRKTAVCSECRRKSKRLAGRRHGKNHKRRARYHGVKYVPFPVRSIFERDNYTCQLCGKAVLQKAAYRKRDGKIHPRSPTIDHIVAMANGGNHEPSNCQTACFICNSRKGDRGGGQLRLAINLDCYPPGRG